MVSRSLACGAVVTARHVDVDVCITLGWNLANISKDVVAARLEAEKEMGRINAEREVHARLAC